MTQESLQITNTATATSIDIFTAKEITLDGIVYKPLHTTEGLKLPFMYPAVSTDESGNTHTQQKICYVLISKEEIMNCLKEYLPELIEASVLKSTQS